MTKQQKQKILKLIATRDAYLDLPKHVKLKPQRLGYLTFLADCLLAEKIEKCLNG